MPTVFIDVNTQKCASIIDVGRKKIFLSGTTTEIVHDIKNTLSDGEHPTVFLCSTFDDDIQHKHGQQRIKDWKNLILMQGCSIETILSGKNNFPLAQTAHWKNIFSTPVTCIDSLSVLMGFSLVHTSISARTQKEGVTIVYAGQTHLQAALIFQNHIYGIYEQHSNLTAENLAADLEQMRLNWLPNEAVIQAGGHGCFRTNLPEEAEGFAPTYILGPKKMQFAKCGRIISEYNDCTFDRCMVLYHLFNEGFI